MNNFISLLTLPMITHWFQQTLPVYLLCRKHWPQGRKGCKYEPEWSVPSGSPCWQTDTDIKIPYKTLMTCPDDVLQEFGGELCSFRWLLMFSDGEKGQLWWCQHFTLCLQPGEKHRAEILLSPLAPLLVPNCKKKDDFVSISSWSHAKAALCFPCPVSLPIPSLRNAWTDFRVVAFCVVTQEQTLLSPPPALCWRQWALRIATCLFPSWWLTVADDPALHKRIMKLYQGPVICVINRQKPHYCATLRLRDI